MTLSPLLILHISAGLIGILAGAAALGFRKGSLLHRKAGNAFFIAMLVMSASASYIALTKGITISVLGGGLTFYLVATAWLIVKRKAGEVGRMEWAALVLGLAVSAGYITFGLEAANSVSGNKGGFPAGLYFFFGTVAGIAAAFDLKMFYAGGLHGTQRITRHLWRMCFAMFMATASFFLGQSQVFPTVIRESHVLFVPVIAVLLITFFWLFKVLFTNLYGKPVTIRD